MPPKRRVKKRRPQPQPNTKVRKKPLEDGGLRFSFKHLDLQDPDFHPDAAQDGYVPTLLQRLKDVNCMSIGELMGSRSSTLRCHPIDWKDTTRQEGFTCLNEQLRDLPPYQFSVSTNAHGRVHGFVLDDTFYVVWLDPDHRLYA